MKTPKDTLVQGLLGPLNIFPDFFFSKELNRYWAKIQLQEASLKGKDKKEYLRNIAKSPLSYLNMGDAKILYFIKVKEVYAHSLNLSEDPQAAYNMQKGIMELHRVRLHLERKKVDDSFVKLSQIFETFFLALSEEGEKSRKLMGLTEFFIDEFKEIEDHPYLYLLRVLTFVGRGKWVSATKSLHEFSNKFPHPGMTKVLIKLYEKIGMPQVSHYLKQEMKTKGQEDHSAIWQAV